VTLGLVDVRRMALGLKGAEELDHHGFPSFRVRGKIFATARDSPARLMIKLDSEDQHNFCAAHPDAIAPVPGYWGRKGATYVDLAQVDGAIVGDLLRLAWARVAPKR